MAPILTMRALAQLGNKTWLAVSVSIVIDVETENATAWLTLMTLEISFLAQAALCCSCLELHSTDLHIIIEQLFFMNTGHKFAHNIV